MADSERYDFVTVTNIPSNFHTADLRAHFSSLVESSSFVCFHFRHRPEKFSEGTPEKDKNSDRKRCCVVKVLRTKSLSFLRYNGQHWTDVNGDCVADKCQVTLVKLKSDIEDENDPETVEEEKLIQMPELRPPELMPNGNVGTPTLVFLDLIQQCLLPHNLINKLQLKFPKTSARRMYGNVDFDYYTSSSHKTVESNDDKSNQFKQSRVFEVIEKPSINKEVRSESCDKNLPQISHKTDSQCLHMEESEIDKSAADISSPHPEGGDSSDSLTGTCSPNRVSGDMTSEHSCEVASVISSNQDFPEATSTSRQHPGNRLKEFTALINKFVEPPAPPVGENSRKLKNRERKELKKAERRRTRKLMAENIEERLISVEKRYQNDEDAEEWDRCEASEDDPSNQERNKERLYEEEIELPWEKGGPGVVFYTDAMFWQEKDGDFDEQTTDDLDVDFSAYEEKGSGDMDIKDFIRIRQEKRFRDGYDKTDRFSIGIGKQLPQFTSHKIDNSRIGEFECHSKGIGRKVMERQGWKEGQGLGKSRFGIVTALKGEGQSSYSKRGLGYTDSKPAVYGTGQRKKPRNETHLITTIYDDPETTDPKEPLLQRREPSTLKHRQSHMDKFSSSDKNS